VDSKELAEFPFKLHSVTHIGAVQVRPEAIAIANEELVRRGLEPGQAGEMKEPDIECLRCKSKMAFAGKKRFYEPRIGGVLGALAEMAAKREEEFDLWTCGNCGHVELFTEPTN
jgi:hypothetical protein